MAKQNLKSKASSTKETAAVAPPVTPAKKLPPSILYFFIFAFSFLIYSNTLWNKYAIDDVIVVTDNKYTKKGTAGIKEHFTHDMFEGFFGERGAMLVSGGRYRPLSMALLSVEYEVTRHMKGDKRDVITDQNVIIGDQDPYLSPFLSHFINVLLFSLTSVTLYYLLTLIIPAKYSLKTRFGDFGVAFFATLLYAAHPIHTEAVANIKGRDEVMCMLFSLLALVAAVKYVRTDKIMHVLWGTLVFFIALLSKENAITFFAVIPLTFFFFTKAKAKHYAIVLLPFLVAGGVFLGMRSASTKAGLGQDTPEVLNNPYILAKGGIKPNEQRITPFLYRDKVTGEYTFYKECFATTFVTFAYYFKTLALPHPLTHDYYYNQIPFVGFDSLVFWLSFLLNIGLLIYAFMGLKKKSIISYCILFYFVTFSVASNFFFTVGVLMNERFIYMSSLGFCILLAYLLVRSTEKYKLDGKIVLVVLLLVGGLYSAKTFTRNFDWKDSFTLFRRDVRWSPNSAKIQTSVGGDLAKAANSDIARLRDSGVIRTIFCDLRADDQLLNSLNSLPDSTISHMLLDSSIAHLNEAIRIYPSHSNAWVLLGNSWYNRRHKPEEVIPMYANAARFNVNGSYDAFFNLGFLYNEINKPDSAKKYLLLARTIKPEQEAYRFLLAYVSAKLNQPDSVEYWLNIGSQKRPVAGEDYYKIGTGFGKAAGNFPLAIEYLKKATQASPKVELYWEDLGVAYGLSGRYPEAIEAANKLIEINPKYKAAYMNLFVSYRMVGNMKMSEESYNKARELDPTMAPYNSQPQSGVFSQRPGNK